MNESNQNIRLKIFFKPSGFMADLTEAPQGRGRGRVRGEQKEQKQTLSREWHEKLTQDPWKGFYQIGFLADTGWMEPSAAYLNLVSGRLIRRLSSLPELELVRADAELPISPEDTKTPCGIRRRAKTSTQTGIILRRNPLRNPVPLPEKKFSPAAGELLSGHACGALPPS